MSFPSLPVRHLFVSSAGECLPACAMMVLDYLGVQVSYARLLRILNVVPDLGAPSFNVRNLNQLGVTVEYGQGTLSTLRKHVEHGRPPIVFVRTGELPYWQTSIEHAVVVIGVSDTQVLVNDPAFAAAPFAVSTGDFDLAWLDRDEYFAVIYR